MAAVTSAEICRADADRVRFFGLAVALGLIVLAAVNVWRYDQPRNAPVQVADQVLLDTAALAGIDGLPAWSESLMGSPAHPIALIVFAKDEAALSDAMLASGWSASRLPTPGLVFDALAAAIEGSEDPTVETISHFWRGQPNDLAFVRRAPGAKPSLADPKVRFWRTEYVTSEGSRVFVVTVGVDEANDAGGGGQVAATNLTLRDAVVKEMQAHGATLAPPLELKGQTGDGQTVRATQAIVMRLP